MDLFRAERFYTEVIGGAMFLKPGMTFHDPSGFSEATGKTHPPGTFIKFGRNHLGFFLQYEVPVFPAKEPGSGYPCWGLYVAEEDFDDVVQRGPRLSDAGWPRAYGGLCRHSHAQRPSLGPGRQ